MRVAVSASGPTLDSQVDPRFGRCAYFVVVDTGTMAAEAIENASVAAAQGAGIATAQMIAGKGVAAVLTGNCGPNAYQALSAAGIQVVTGVTGSVRDAARAYASGQMQPSDQPNVASHHGMGLTQGRGMGGGTMRSEAPARTNSSASQPATGVTDLLLDLKMQLDALREQVAEISNRIDQLHKQN
ncbi:MAG: dinitrogenase iron-molybdenum cofactor biosynthesis protein [Dehalococcoidia bacterium]|nr:dinitrogenase iron-molybdenum cofactor biosynthesis protein [Dehalococcoidia bacterium]